MESAHNAMHGFVNMGGAHISFRDPFVFLLHSNQDRLYSRWQTDPLHPARLIPDTVYGTESGDAELNGLIEPWSTGHSDAFGVEHFTAPGMLRKVRVNRITTNTPQWWCRPVTTQTLTWP